MTSKRIQRNPHRSGVLWCSAQHSLVLRLDQPLHLAYYLPTHACLGRNLKDDEDPNFLHRVTSPFSCCLESVHGPATRVLRHALHGMPSNLFLGRNYTVQVSVERLRWEVGAGCGKRQWSLGGPPGIVS